ncbi:Inner membrane protein YohK [Pigmentiphaga humi]|uniref:Inner membrane protein YohK n=1 Tax=Pigmentiphaga humi TaxID=2478468 RepID=A0A3P4B9I5_9BURK|nr:LrgB family protein [Pigmentiphaga humi]VCU72260.1 Inner membrane protein YohK [Pigmentiphaga humi]
MMLAFCLAATVVLYCLNKVLYARHARIWTHPILLTPAMLAALLLATGISLDEYTADTRLLLWFLGPATVAFAVPIYEYRRLIREQWLALAIGTLAGVAAAVGTSWGLAHLLHLSPEVTNSLLVRSVSTPFALATADTVGGNADLAVMFVVFTGLAGMLMGEIVLAVMPRRSRMASGASYGAAAHALGTVRARELSEEAGVMASLLMIFSGLVMVLVAPALGHWLA